jgi:alkylation response protein AidB-like acyl-CoA dehydrogenase
MDFSLTDENNAVFDMAYEFGQEFIAPYALAWEKEGNIPKDLWAKAGELGLGGIYVSEEFGGSGLDRFSATLIFEALAMACPSVGSFLTIHNMCGGMIEKFGSLELKEKWLPKLCKMETIFSYCLSEPGSGSDAAALKTKAKKNK